ncbi:MAG TPA: GNAT family N-acetyltransferase [Microbacterium sp.]|nr:GNAT family N-acetyltransferase [Microbacterium sp.]
MTETLTKIVITSMVIPSRTDAPDSEEFRTMIDLRNQMTRIDAGIDDLDDTPEQILPSWLDQTDRLRRGFIARSHGQIVGAASITTSSQPGTTSAELELMLLPAQWESGVGRALLERAEQETLALGRDALLTWTLHPADPRERMLKPATGWGEVAPTPMSDLLEMSGHTLEQVARNSVLALDGSLERAKQSLTTATAFAGSDYRLISWTLPTPRELRAGYAGVIARMATDVPSGNLDITAETWDAERIVRHDAQFAAGGQTVSVAAVIHEPTGNMVAINELCIGSDLAGVTHQWGTLVVKEHRGKRLGTIVKCANLLRWHEVAPDSPKISTFNAEENRPMLDINEAIGFVAASYAGAWQKKLC